MGYNGSITKIYKNFRKPLLDFKFKKGKLSLERLEEINQRTRDGGAEIFKYLEKGSAFYAPAASGVQMAEAYLKDEKKLLPCAVILMENMELKIFCRSSGNKFGKKWCRKKRRNKPR
ncbi:MAG: hypothetical protein CM1200mP13_15490 [Candidatus Pelagibacterales bacterium]|nr:MAG: hypothetical protein CM1200mP13_15490 [Pelagibacterales bacterium]